MYEYELEDLLLSEDGDLVLDEDGDIQMGTGARLVDQIVSSTMKSTNPEWFLESFPADLEDLIGLENSRDTAELGKKKIREGLLKTNMIDEDNVWIEAKPVSPTEILFFVFVNLPDEKPIAYQVSVNLEFGMSVRKVNA